MLKHFTNLEQFPRAVREVAIQDFLAPDHSLIDPKINREWVLLKTWKVGSLSEQLTPKWKEPYVAILDTLMAGKIIGISSWIYLNQVKSVPWTPTERQQNTLVCPLKIYNCSSENNV